MIAKVDVWGISQLRYNSLGKIHKLAIIDVHNYLSVHTVYIYNPVLCHNKHPVPWNSPPFTFTRKASCAKLTYNIHEKRLVLRWTGKNTVQGLLFTARQMWNAPSLNSYWESVTYVHGAYISRQGCIIWHNNGTQFQIITSDIPST